MSKSKVLIAAALALTGALGAGLAQAHGRNDVQWSVTIGAPAYSAPAYVQPAPVYVQPAPAYVQPAPAYIEPAPVYGHRGYRYDGYRQPTRWDRDGDGVPNRYDPVYNPRWDRDGDGVPNRYDRHDNRRRY